MFDIGWTELLLIGIVALIVIGPKDLPDAIKGVAKGIQSLRRVEEVGGVLPLGAVVLVEEHQADRHRVDALRAQGGDEHEVAARLAHLLAVEAHHRERVGGLQRLPFADRRDPGPGCDRAFGTDLDHLGQRLTGVRVVLDRRAHDTALGVTNAENAMLTQGREERPDHGTGRAPEVESDGQRCAQQLLSA